MFYFFTAELAVLKLVDPKNNIHVQWSKDPQNKSSLTVSPNVCFDNSVDICRYLARNSPESGLYGCTVLEQIEVSTFFLVLS